MSDTERMIARALDGDRAALDALFARHRGRLLAWLGLALPAQLARRVPAEDLVQETLLEASRKLDHFEPRGPSSFYAWLVGIARHKLSEAQRAESAEKRSGAAPLERDPTGTATSPTQAAVRADRAEHVRAAIARLPAPQAEALQLRYLEGLSTAEVARRLERSEMAVKALVTRAFAELTAQLGPQMADSAPPPRRAPPLQG
jgi:RNA polymerase sigma-70 factor (ECF subfamily)